MSAFNFFNAINVFEIKHCQKIKHCLKKVVKVCGVLFISTLYTLYERTLGCS